MSGMFHGCQNFYGNIRDWNVDRVVIENENPDIINNIFSNCSIPNRNKPRRFNIFNEDEDDEVEQEDVIQIGIPYINVNANNIHKETDKVDNKVLLKFFAKHRSTYTDISNPPDEGYPQYIENTLMIMMSTITESTITENEDLKNSFDRIKEMFLYINFQSKYFETQVKLIVPTLTYVMDQPPIFKSVYVKTFVYDCVHAYNNNNITCPKGALERIYMSLIPTTVVAMTTPNIEIKPEWEVLKSILEDNPGPIFQPHIGKWYMDNSNDAFRIIQYHDDDDRDRSRRNLLKTYLISVFPLHDILIIEKMIRKYADTIGYDNDNFTYDIKSGGRRRRRRKTHRKAVFTSRKTKSKLKSYVRLTRKRRPWSKSPTRKSRVKLTKINT
jgi:hypothetical protein